MSRCKPIEHVWVPNPNYAPQTCGHCGEHELAHFVVLTPDGEARLCDVPRVFSEMGTGRYEAKPVTDWPKDDTWVNPK